MDAIMRSNWCTAHQPPMTVEEIEQRTWRAIGLWLVIVFTIICWVGTISLMVNHGKPETRIERPRQARP